MAKKNLKKGQTSMEYMLILGVLVAVIMIFGRTMKDRIGGMVNKAFNKGDEAVDRGAASE
jgi:Flp pilus assembly pilin Flp